MVTDIKVFVEGLQVNTTLTELDFSRNDILDKLGLARGLAKSLRLVYRPALLHGYRYQSVCGRFAGQYHSNRARLQ